MSRFKRFLLITTIVFAGFFLLSNETGVSLILGLFIGVLSLPFDTKDVTIVEVH